VQLPLGQGYFQNFGKVETKKKRKKDRPAPSSLFCLNFDTSVTAGR